VKLQLRGGIEIFILLLLLQTFPVMHRVARGFSAAACKASRLLYPTPVIQCNITRFTDKLAVRAVVINAFSLIDETTYIGSTELHFTQRRRMSDNGRVRLFTCQSATLLHCFETFVLTV